MLIRIYKLWRWVDGETSLCYEPRDATPLWVWALEPTISLLDRSLKKRR
jgi:hypothetical protein